MMMISKAAPNFIYSLSFFIFLLILFPLGAPESFSAGNAEREIQIFSEAVREIENKALLPKSRMEIIRGSLKAYLNHLDQFSDYISPEEYAAFKKSVSGQYVGLGMDIEENKAGNYICFPYPDQPAYRAGVRSGDILLAIDGMSVSGKTVFQIAAEAMGENNTKIALKIKKQNGKEREVLAVRDAVVSKTVASQKKGGFHIIRILRFTPNTPREIKLALGNAVNKSDIIIDLRENPGGDLHAAIDSAMLFLKKGKKIVDVASRNSERSYICTAPPIHVKTPLFIWQDEYTASAAEVFTAALVQNGRAESVGRKSFGKGVQQKIIELSDGSALFLTTAYLKTPNGMIYHEIGLQPTHSVKSGTADLSVYLAETKQLLSRKSGWPAVPNQSHPENNNADIIVFKPEKQRPVLSPPVHQAGNPTELSQKRSFLICFDEDFEMEKEAEIWTSTTANSIQTDRSFYLFQRKTSEGAKFFVCLGLYSNKEAAESRRFQISRAMNTEMFIKEQNNNEIKRTPEPAGVLPGASGRSWSIQTGSYQHFASVISSLEKIQMTDKEKKFPLWVRIIYSGSEPPLSDKNYFEGNGVEVQVLKADGFEESLAYKLFIGPYGSRNEALLTFLKKGGAVEDGAYWVQTGK